MTNSPPFELWLCDLTHTQQTIASNTIPLAIGMLGAYINEKLEDQFKIKLFKFPDDLINEFKEETPSVIGFSNYVWNQNLNCALAKEIKKKSPSTITVFGGPNFSLISDERLEFLTKNEMIDFYISGEGEGAFYELLKLLIQHKFDIEKVKAMSLPNSVYLFNGKLVEGKIAERMDMSSIPSPYLNGLLDSFFTEQMMPLVQTNRGCPFSCTYCTEGTPKFNKLSFRDMNLVEEEFEYIAKRNKGSKNLFIADSNFGMYSRDIEVCNAIARTQDDYGWPDYINVAVGKNKKSQILKVAKIIRGALRLGASVQSMDPQVLKNIKRENISIDEIIEVAIEGNSIESNTYAEVILGLPGDTKEAHFKTIEYLVNAGLNFIRCYTLMMLKGTQMASSEEREKYGMVTKFRALPRCFGAYPFREKLVPAIEIEEVCVANNTLSFQEYLDCRTFNLVVEVFYNDSILNELFTLLKDAAISPYKLIREIYNSIESFPKSLSNLFRDFRQETADELWNTEKEIYEFACNEEIIKKYTHGIYGSNLIFKYKSLGLIKHLEEVYELAYDTAWKIIEQSSHIKETNAYKGFLNELKIFALLKKNNIFRINDSYTHLFNYDLESLNSGTLKQTGTDLRLKDPIKISFKHLPEQKRVIEDSIKEFGDTVIGISRIFSRVNIKKMYRNGISIV